MNRKTILPILLCVLGMSLISCEKHEVVFDHPFVYVTDNVTNVTNSARIDSKGNYEETYAIILSSKTLDKNLVVNYEMVPGNGLEAGVDYELLSSGQVTFTPGLYVIPIHVRWIPREVDESVDESGKPLKDNSVRIVLKSNSMDFTMGYPGPDKLNSYYTITKMNMKM